jgi:hypothetical protein
MFGNIESGTAKSRPLWARIGALILGIACFFPAFFLSLLATIPWSKHYWAGDGQAVLGGIAVSFWFGIAFAIAASVYLLKRATPKNR